MHSLKSWRKILPLMLAVVLTVGMMPAAAFAADGNATWDGDGAPSISDTWSGEGNTITVSGVISGTLTVPANTSVTVTGNATSTAGIGLFLLEGASVTWAATLTGNTSSALMSVSGIGELTIAAEANVENSGTGDGVWLASGSLDVVVEGTIDGTFTVQAGNVILDGAAVDEINARYNSGSIEITGGTTVAGGIEIGSDCTVNITGTANIAGTVDGNATITDTGTVTVPVSETLIVDNGSTLTNKGTITVNGTLTNNGKISNIGTITGTVGGNEPVDGTKNADWNSSAAPDISAWAGDEGYSVDISGSISGTLNVPEGCTVAVRNFPNAAVNPQGDITIALGDGATVNWEAHYSSTLHSIIVTGEGAFDIVTGGFFVKNLTIDDGVTATNNNTLMSLSGTLTGDIENIGENAVIYIAGGNRGPVIGALSYSDANDKLTGNFTPGTDGKVYYELVWKNYNGNNWPSSEPSAYNLAYSNIQSVSAFYGMVSAADGSFEIECTRDATTSRRVYLAATDSDGFLGEVRMIELGTESDGDIDATFPVLTAGTPGRTSDTAATVPFTSNEAGTYYYQLDGTAPTAATLTGSGAGTAMESGNNTINLVLAAGAHTVYIASKDTEGNVSNLLTVTVPAFSTPSTPVITIETQPAANTAVTEGNISGALSVSAAVTEGATLSYQWFQNTTGSNTGGTLIEGETGASYTVPATLTAAGSPYHYYAVVSATGGAAPVTSSVATVTVSIKPAVATPVDLIWDTATPGKAAFAAPEVTTGITGYEISLYKNGALVDNSTATIAAAPFEKDYTDLITTTGSYTFRVISKAGPTDEDWTDSAAATSPAYAFTAKLMTPAGLTFSEAGVAGWTAVEGATNYTAELLRNSLSLNPVVTADVTDNNYGFLAAMKAAGAGTYTFKVTANGNADNSDYLDSDTAISSGTGGEFVMYEITADITLPDAVLVKGDATSGILPSTVDFDTHTGISVIWDKTLSTASAGKYDFAGTPADLPYNLSAGGKKATLTVYVLDIATDTEKLYLNMSDEGASNIGTITAELLPPAYTGGNPEYRWAVTGTNVTVTNSTASAVTLTADGPGNVTATVTITVNKGGIGQKDVTKNIDIVVTDNALTPLAAPGALTFENGIASWGAVENAVGYEVRLYKDGAPLGDPIEVGPDSTTLSHSFLAAMREAGTGSYTFNVTALGDDETTMNSAASVSSAFVIEAIVSIAAPPPVTNVRTGTSQASAGLPATVTATLSGGGTAPVPAIWSGWDNGTAKTITMAGTLGALPNNVVNSGNVSVPPLSVTFVAGTGGGGGGGGGSSTTTPPASSNNTGTGNTTISGTATTTNSDGSVTLTGSGTVKVGEAVTVAAPSGTTVSSNGTVTIPTGKTAGVTLSDNSRITVPGGTTISGNGTATVGNGTVAMITPESRANVTVTEGSTIAPDGRVTVGSNGATVGLTNGAEITVSDGATINGDRITAGAGGATVKAADGTTSTVPTGTVLILDPDTPLGYSVQISNPFNDVAESGWYYEAVMFVYQNGIMQGTGSGFAPTTTLNRAMLVQMLYNLEGKPASGSSAFSDVSGSDWYSSAVGWASGNNIVSGMTGNMFAPGQSITREQMAVMLYNYCVYKGIILPTVNTGGTFADTGEISSWATDAVNAMYLAGVLNGKGDGMFDPKGTATRAEVAQMFMNFMEAME